MRLAQADPDSRLYVALTHGMAPFEQIGEPNGNAYRLLYCALCEAAGEPKCNEREIVKAYRGSWMSQAYRPDIAKLCDELKTGKRYPNSAELLRVVIGTNRLSGGITELDKAKHNEHNRTTGRRVGLPGPSGFALAVFDGPAYGKQRTMMRCIAI